MLYFPMTRMVIAAMTLLLATTTAQAQKMVVAYVPNWIDLPAFTGAIDYGKITHINIAFENPTNGSGDLSFNPNNAVLIKKAREKGVKVLISIGGGSAADDDVLKPRYFDLLTDAKRAGFVAKLTDYVVKHNFDGLDVDIEGPSINKDYGAFIADLAKALKPKGKLLTAALSKGYGGDRVPTSTFAHFDFINIMAYDGTGPWNPNRAGQHSSFDMAKESVAYWLGRGLPKSKAVLGVPFYGYGFGDSFRNRDYPYSELVRDYPDAELKDEVAKTIYYNGIPTIKAKAKYVLEQGLAGVMIWSLDSDAKGEKSLLSALHESLGNKERSAESQ